VRLERVLYQRFTAPTTGGSLATGRRPGREPKTPGERIKELERVYGTQRAAAAAAGVPVSTWQHVKSGRRQPSDVTMRRLVDAGWAWRMRNQDAYATYPGIVMVATTSISQDVRTRPLRIGQWASDTAPRAMDAVQAEMVARWLSGDQAGCAALMEGVVEACLGLGKGEFAHHVDVVDVRYFATQSAADSYAGSVGTTIHRPS
jgi:hypothetical protein